MSEKRSSVPSQSEDGLPASQPIGSCVAFLIWGIGGVTALVSLWVLILRTAPWKLSPLDAVYWAIVLVMLGARWVGWKRYADAGATDQPVDPSSFRRYSVALIGASCVGWLIAQSFGV